MAHHGASAHNLWKPSTPVFPVLIFLSTFTRECLIDWRNISFLQIFYKHHFLLTFDPYAGDARHLRQECYTSQRLRSERDSNLTYIMRADHEFYCTNTAPINHKVTGDENPQDDTEVCFSTQSNTHYILLFGTIFHCIDTGGSRGSSSCFETLIVSLYICRSTSGTRKALVTSNQPWT